MKELKNLKQQIETSLGIKKADLVIKNAKVLNVFIEQFEEKDIAINNGIIVGVGAGYEGKIEIDAKNKFIVPGFIDSHVHLESSIVSPLEYAKVVAQHGTTAVITDPHEITNVLGKDGIEYMLKATENLPIDVNFMAPSCVPATQFDENGATIGFKEIEELFKYKKVLGIAEMMNYVGVITSNEQVLQKIIVSQLNNKIIDGHAPGLTGKNLNAYITAGVQSDHECTNKDEALEKLSKGQWIMIREGTSCKNLNALKYLIQKPYADRCMFATDDKHISELMKEGHIDHIIRLAIKQGANPIISYKMASYNPAYYFGLKNQGAIACGYRADLVILNDIKKVSIDSVYKAGINVNNFAYKKSSKLSQKLQQKVLNSVHLSPVNAKDFSMKKTESKIIGVINGEILTTDEGFAKQVDVSKDICKIAVVERHKNTGHIGLCFLKGYGLKHGAIATSVSHDSHNIIVAGCTDDDMAVAVNKIIEMQGGMVVVDNGKIVCELALPIAGLMCDKDANEVGNALLKLKQHAYALGINNKIDPFMTLSFVSLPVIPSLRLLTTGVFDVNSFSFV